MPSSSNVGPSLSFPPSTGVDAGSREPVTEREKAETAQSNAPRSPSPKPSPTAVELKLRREAKLQEHVVEIESREQAHQLIHDLRNNIKDWIVAPPARPNRLKSMFSKSTRREYRNDQSTVRDWNERVQLAVNNLSEMDEHISRHPFPSPSLQLLAYQVSGKPVGLLLVGIRKPRPCIEHFATHPGQKNAGSSLLERTVQVSVKADFEGSLEVEPASADVAAFYRKFGFHAEDSRAGIGSYMVLTPASRPDIWNLMEENGKKIPAGLKQFDKKVMEAAV